MIKGGFGVTLDIKTGQMRRWYMRADSIKRWADNDKPVKDEVKSEMATHGAHSWNPDRCI